MRAENDVLDTEAGQYLGQLGEELGVGDQIRFDIDTERVADGGDAIVELADIGFSADALRERLDIGTVDDFHLARGDGLPDLGDGGGAHLRHLLNGMPIQFEDGAEARDFSEPLEHCLADQGPEECIPETSARQDEPIPKGDAATIGVDDEDGLVKGIGKDGASGGLRLAAVPLEDATALCSRQFGGEDEARQYGESEKTTRSQRAPATGPSSSWPSLHSYP